MFEFTGWHLEELEHDLSPLSLNGGSTPIAPSVALRPIMYSNDGEESTPVEIVILKQFEFVSDLRRMSVLVQRKVLEKSKFTGSDGIEVFVKGAPEVMQSICIPESSTIFPFLLAL
jgi:cation-transporting P-type ATPase 13A2